MRESDEARVAGDGVEVSLEPGEEPRLVVRFDDAGAPALTCALHGRVDHATVARRGGELVFGLRPSPGVALSGPGELELEVSVRPDPSGHGLTLEVDGPPDYPFDRLVVPGVFWLADHATQPWHFLVPHAEGLSLPAVQRSAAASRSLPRELDLFGDWITLPVMALTRGHDARGGSLLVSSRQGEDHTVGLLEQEDGRGPGFELIQRAVLGRFAYRRTWRLQWVPRSGLVALADVIRSELRLAGMRLDPLPTKLAARGMPDQLIDSVGGTHLWWHVDPVPSWLPGRLREEGARSVVLMGRLEPKIEQEAQQAAMVAGAYFMSSDIYPPGVMRVGEWRSLFPPEGFTDGWPDQLARTREGWLIPNWIHTPAPEPVNLWESEEFLTEHGARSWRPRAVEEFHPTQGHLRCPHFHEETVINAALPVVDHAGCSGVFCDVTTAAGSIECHSLTHPCDRRTDTASRRRELELLGDRGRFVSSECGKWWALDVADAFEGTLKYENHLNNRVLGDYPFRADWWDTEFHLEYRIPLLGLVARHAVVRTQWWGHGHDRHPESWGAKDALCALFGANPIFVGDPAHPLEPGTAKWERFLRTVGAFDVLRQETFGLGITAYDIVDRHVGRTQFENGTQVRANVGPEDRDGLPAGSFEIHDADGRRLWP